VFHSRPLVGWLLCCLLTTVVMADDKKEEKQVVASSQSEVGKQLSAVLEDSKKLNAFFGQQFGKISSTMSQDADAAEAMIAALEEALKTAEPESEDSKELIPRAHSAIGFFRSRLELARVSIDDLKATLKENANQPEKIQQFSQKAAEVIRNLASDSPDKAQAELDGADKFLGELAGEDAEESLTKAIDAAKSSLQRHQRSIDSAKKMLELIGKDMAPLQVTSWVNGSSLTDKDLKGKVVLLDFWAVWCGPCIATFPHLIEWQEKYADKDFVMIGLTRFYKRYGFDEETGKLTPATEPLVEKQEADMVQQFAKYHKITHRLALQPDDSKMNNYYGVTGIPHVTIVDKKGKIRMIKVGSGPANSKAISELLEKLMNEKS